MCNFRAPFVFANILNYLHSFIKLIIFSKCQIYKYFDFNRIIPRTKLMSSDNAIPHLRHRYAFHLSKRVRFGLAVLDQEMVIFRYVILLYFLYLTPAKSVPLLVVRSFVVRVEFSGSKNIRTNYCSWCCNFVLLIVPLFLLF